MAQPCRPGASLEPFLAAQRHFVVEKEAEPFGVAELARLGRGLERLESLGHAIEAEGMQKVDGRVVSMEVSVSGSSRGREHWDDRSPPCFRAGRSADRACGEDRSDALVIERTYRDGSGRDRLSTRGIEALEEPEHAQAGAEALLGVRPIGEDGDDKPFGARPDRAAQRPEPLRRPFGATPPFPWHQIDYNYSG